MSNEAVNLVEANQSKVNSNYPKIRAMKHGHSRLGKQTLTHRTWVKMRARCSNKCDMNYHYYGGRGISVCSKFDSFNGFLEIMGERPPETSLDRKDNNGNYSCGECKECLSRGWVKNVRWATREIQMNNTRRNIWLSFMGQTLTLKQWSDKTGIGYSTLLYRVTKYQWGAERALTEPVHVFIKNNRIAFNGEQLTIVEWARKLNMRRASLAKRLRVGWSVEKALTTPIRK